MGLVAPVCVYLPGGFPFRCGAGLTVPLQAMRWIGSASLRSVWNVASVHRGVG